MGTPPISYYRCIRGREVGGEWIFFTAKHFVIKKNLLTLHLEKMLYNIVIQHKNNGQYNCL